MIVRYGVLLIGDDGTLSGFTVTGGNTMTNLGMNNTYAGGVFCFTTNALIENCIISNCISYFRAGGVFQGVVNNCKIVNNTAGEYGGGAYQCILNNCTVVDNISWRGVSYSTLNNCVVWNNKGANDQTYNWLNCSFNYSCTLPAATNGVGNITNNPQFVSGSDYRLAVGSPCMDSGGNAYVQSAIDLDGNQRIYDGTRDGSAVVDMGCYESIIKNKWYVDVASPHDGPGMSWSTAYHNIQAAISAAQDNDTVIVTNGVYASSGLIVAGSLGNRAAINKQIVVESVNGPDVTIIKGYGGVDGDDARRCAYVGTNAVLAGFTLREGHTRTNGIASDKVGGGVWCEDSGVVSNCIVTENSANQSGGGVYHGTISRCTISSNSAEVGGGVYGGMLDNSLVIFNSSGSDGGGGYSGTFVNCTVSSNSASGDGGGVYNATMKNSIIWGNTSSSGNSNWLGGSFSYCTAAPLPSGVGNTSADPAFNDEFHPLRTSCLDTGNNDDVVGLYDLSGEYRILHSVGVGTVVDMGCFEYFYGYADSDGDLMSDSWERWRGLNYADASDAGENPDIDGANNYEEYIAYTDPHDSNSFFTVTAFSNSQDVTLFFDSASQRVYTLMSCSNLLDDSWANVPGAESVTGGGISLSDTNEPLKGHYYKVKVELP